MELCLKDSCSSGFLLIYAPQIAAEPVAIARVVTELAKQTNKPILTCLMGQDLECRKALRLLHKSGVPTFPSPQQAVSTFMAMYHYTQGLELLYQTPEEISIEPSNSAALKSIIKHASSQANPLLSYADSLRFLEAYKFQP